MELASFVPIMKFLVSHKYLVKNQSVLIERRYWQMAPVNYVRNTRLYLKMEYNVLLHLVFRIRKSKKMEHAPSVLNMKQQLQIFLDAKFQIAWSAK